MAKGYTKLVRKVLTDHGCEYVRHGKGDHDIWQSPINDARFVVDNNIPSRHLANTVLKQAGIKVKLS